MDGFIEVYALVSGLKQRVPAHFLDDPLQSRVFAKTPQQRALDGELGQRPGEEAKIDELRAFAEAAEVDITGLRSKAEIRAAIDAAVGTEELPEPGSADGVAVEPGGDPDVPAGTPPEGTPSEPSIEDGQSTPAAGDEGAH